MAKAFFYDEWLVSAEYLRGRENRTRPVRLELAGIHIQCRCPRCQRPRRDRADHQTFEYSAVQVVRNRFNLESRKQIG
jgi:hypothetical protein